MVRLVQDGLLADVSFSDVLVEVRMLVRLWANSKYWRYWE